MDYRNEYHNYKQKYLALKNKIKQQGGVEPPTPAEIVMADSDDHLYGLYKSYYDGFGEPTDHNKKGLPLGSTSPAISITLDVFGNLSENEKKIYYKNTEVWLKFITERQY